MNSIDRIIFKSNDIPTTYLISNSIEGYLNTTDGKFYKESSYTTEIAGAATMLYLDKATNKLYRYNESNHQYIAIAGGGGSSITVDDEINSSSTNPVQNKVIYSALENKVDNSLKGANDGIAELDSNGKLNSSQLPLGETSSTAYRGDRGKTAYDHSQITSGNPHNVTASEIGLGNVNNTADIDKPISTAVQTALDLKADSEDLGTAAAKNVPTSGNASTTEVVMGNDTRLTDARNAADVSAWAKAANKPSYNGSEITTSTAKTGTAQQSITNTVASGTSVDNVVETMLNNDKTLDTNVNSLKETLTNFEESITGEVVDSEPYVLRQGKGNMVDLDLVGGSVAWNQLVSNGNFASTSGWSVGSNTTFTASNNIGKVVPIDSSNSNQRFIRQTKAIPVNHKVLVMLELSGNNECTIGFYSSSWQDAAILTFNITNNKATYSQIASLSKDSANVGLYFSNSTEVNISNFMCIDLTQLFGSTIADYIYSLEQATAGAGVAWFRQYFPNAYYAYNVGEIESVNVGARIASKNLFNPDKFVRGLLNSADGSVTGSNQWITSDYIPIFDNTKITVSAWAEKGEKCFWVRFCQYDKDKNFISNASNQDVSGNTYWSNPKTLDSRTKYVRLTFGFDNKDITVSSFFATNDIQLEYGENGSNYEAYGKYTFPFDSSKQLRGIPKLVDNKLSYDGDIYTADGTVTRKYGIVDLGSLTYSKDNNNAFYATLSSAVTGVIGTTMNGICSNGYQVVQTKGSVADILAQGDNIFAMQSGSKLLYIKDTSKASMTTTEFKTAMSGIYLVYELATPTTESATPYQNPQRAFIDGTEEFVDYGVQSATRDVSIPVGNSTTYQLNETLPPIEDYVDGALKFKAAISALGTDESGRTTASRTYTTGEFFYKDGKMYKVLTSIAQGATFTINTNCQQTTLFAELKALAQ